uniref:AIG1-type G domain-containing protein n=1 Tax=Sparus aurata TaxID=8175 RepID=A0A671WJD3_SPAAU
MAAVSSASDTGKWAFILCCTPRRRFPPSSLLFHWQHPGYTLRAISWDPRGRHPPERRLLILGGPRSGKTSTANTILGEEVFDSGAETTHSNVGQTEIFGRRVTVVDTPPWAIPSDPEDQPERIRQDPAGRGLHHQSWWLVSSGIHINANTNVFPAENKILMR